MARHREDRDIANVIVDMFFIIFVLYFALIDISSTHSFLASTIFVNLGIFVDNTSGRFLY